MSNNRNKIKKQVKKPQYRHRFHNTVFYAITPNHHADTLIEDVNRLVERMKTGKLDKDTILELKRVKEEIVIKNQQNRVIKECGKESLVTILREVAKIRRKTERNNPSISPLNMNEKKSTVYNETEVVNNKLRRKWNKWFSAKYERELDNNLFEEMRNASLNVDFTQMVDKRGKLSLNKGFDVCYNLAMTKMKKEGTDIKTESWSPTRRYNGIFSQRTNKEYGSVFKPVRIGR